MTPRRAFTLLEILITMAVAAAILGLTMVAMRRPIQSAGSRGMAEQVGEAFRAARQLALAEQSPVALLVPSEAGKNCSQSLALVRGQDHPAIARVLNYSKEFPRCVLFVGSYPSSQSWSKDPPETGRSRFWEAANGGGVRPLLHWLGTRCDYIFLFTPDGTVHSNDLPHRQGNYYLVVSQGVEASPTSVSGSGLPVAYPPPSWGLTAACDPYTVVVRSQGAIEVVPGLPERSGGVQERPQPLPLAAVASAPTLTVEPVENPTLVEVRLNPSGSVGGSLGVSGTLDPRRQVTVDVQATITTSDDLFCDISTSGRRPSSGTPLPGGSFSTPGSKRMYFAAPLPPLTNEGRWFSSWQWNPPPEALPGDQFTFTVTVRTRRGGLVTSAGDATLTRTVEMYDQGRIFFGAQDPYTSKYLIFSIRADGTDLVRVTHDEVSTAQLYPAATRDGNKMLFAAVEPFVSSDLYGLSRTGGLSTRITTENKPAFRSHFSDDASVGCYEGADSSSDPMQLHCFNPNGAWPPPVASIFVPSPCPGSHPVGCQAPVLSDMRPFTLGSLTPATTRRCDAPRRLAWHGDCLTSGVSAIYTSNFCNPGTPLDGSAIPGPANIRRQTNGGPGNVFAGGDRAACWHPSTNYLAFQSDRSGSTNRIFKVMFSETGHPAGADGAVCLTPTQDNCLDPYYSPRGDRICWISNDTPGGDWDIFLQNIDPTTGDPIAGTVVRLNLSSFTPFTGGFPALNRPVWTL